MLSNFTRYVGVNDNSGKLFENQWPLPKGVAYNSYLAVDRKIALVDTAAAGFGDEFIGNIRREIGERPIDYLIIDHMEPDHSALISVIRAQYPDIKIVTNAKAVPMIAGYQGVDDNIQTVKDGDIITLGDCSLTFRMIPMVHWPETMVTYMPEEKTLFSGDAFGCFGSVHERIDGFKEFRDEMVRYYSCIVGKYGQPVQAALKKLSALPLARICSTHGPVWENDIPEVLDLYDRMSRYMADPGVCIVYGSMYGNTEKAARALQEEILKRGVKCVMHNAMEEDASFIYKDTFEYDTIVCGSPTYNNDILPAVRNVLYGIVSRMVKNHKFAAFGSYTWAGASVRLMNEMAESAGLHVVSPGRYFAQAYAREKFDVKTFADEILGASIENDKTPAAF